MSPALFNTRAKKLLKKALAETRGIVIGGGMVNRAYIKYADDRVTFVGNIRGSIAIYLRDLK